MDVDVKKRRLPRGTSEYQAAWILDDHFSDEETEEVDLQSPRTATGNTQPDDRREDQSWDEDMEDAEVGRTVPKPPMDFFKPPLFSFLWS